MRGRIRSIFGHDVQKLAPTWEMCALSPKALAGAAGGGSTVTAGDSLDGGYGGLGASLGDRIGTAGGVWEPATSGQTVAAALRAAGKWALEGAARNFDAEDWFFRARFPRPLDSDETVLRFDGLATVAEVFLNGTQLTESRSMFLAHEHKVASLLEDDNELVIRFRSLENELLAKRPRPRFRAPMITNQQIRWFRTTLLGRTPGWSPPAAAVGPWREIWLERRHTVAVSDVMMATLIDGKDAFLNVSCTVRPLGPYELDPVAVSLKRNGVEYRALLERVGETRFSGTVQVPNVARWWPHTHGEPALYEARLLVDALSGKGVKGENGEGEGIEVSLGPVGFRDVAFHKGEALTVNGVRVFCRGACWTPLDPVTLDVSAAEYDRAIVQAARGGMNMIRVGGTMTYEADAFYDALDRHGMLLWQDFMFANLDYPADDEAFGTLIKEETKQFLTRMQGRPSVAVYCGNSEIEQQAAMWGAAREAWSPPLFSETLPALCRELAATVPYWPSSTHGGSFPHDPSEGTCSYYGVGAYLRDVTDARRSSVRFGTECLAFANVPAPEKTPFGASARVHHASWKSRTPRDLGAGWDFDDIRDHYVGTMFRTDVLKLRYEDHGRYLALGRVVTGELMAASMGEWRTGASPCGGALIWFLRDFWPSAGWGVVDSTGQPKAAYFIAKRAMQPVAIHISDEGLSGPVVHIANDRPVEASGILTITSFKDDGTVQETLSRNVTVKPHGTLRLPVLSLADHWSDLTHAYRFGPRTVDVMAASFKSAETETEAFFFPGGLPNSLVTDVGLTASAKQTERGEFEIVLESRLFAQSVELSLDNFDPVDNYLHVLPGQPKSVRIERTKDGPVRGTAQPLNARTTTKIIAS